MTTDRLRPFHSQTYERNTKSGTAAEACCLCGKETAGLDGAIHVPINHCTGEFATAGEADAKPNDVSLYPIGPDCAKKWAKAFPDAIRNRFRRGPGGKVIPYDVRKAVL